MIVERHSIEILFHIYWANVIAPQIFSPFSVQFFTIHSTRIQYYRATRSISQTMGTFDNFAI